jgi:sec-independent protein translocase protein TatC
LVAFGICFWQNHALLHLLNRALPHVSTVSGGQRGLNSISSQSVKERQGLLKSASAFNRLAIAPGVSAEARQAYAQAAQGITAAAKALPRTAPAQEKPITIGVGEPFTTTLTVAAYFALLFTLPLLIYEGYAFVIPALNPTERRVAVPLMAVAPALFLIGVAFAYAVVLPPAVHFLQGYNSNAFDILVQAKAYYTFEILTMLGIGLAFQMPIGLLGLHRLGAIDGSTLTRHWRYAVVIIAVVAAAMPGADPVTTGLETLPLVVLFLVSIVMLKIADRRAAARAAAEPTQPLDGGLDPT